MPSKTYYERNKERIKKRLRDLYHSDSKFREEQIRRSIESRKKRTERLKLEKQRLIIEQKKWRKLKVKDDILECCRIGTLAEALGRDIQTIRLWQKKNQFPNTITYKKHRYFTRYQYDVVLKLWKKYDNGNKNKLPFFFEELKKEWKIK